MKPLYTQMWLKDIHFWERFDLNSCIFPFHFHKDFLNDQDQDFRTVANIPMISTISLIKRHIDDFPVGRINK